MLIRRSCAAAAFLLAALAAGAAEYRIAIDSSKDVYAVGETVHFVIAVTRDGVPFDTTSASVIATFPDADTDAALVEIGPGALVLDVPATEPPVFGAVLPDGIWTNNPYAMILAEVTDAGSGVESVLLIREDASEPIVMDVVGGVATYAPPEGWNDGANSLLIVAFDNAGNAATTERVLRVDTLAPAFTSFSPEATNNASPTLVITVVDDLSGVDPESITLILDGNRVDGAFYEGGVIMYIPGQSLVPGPHDVDVSATDFAGNTGSGSFSLFVLP